MNQNLKKINIYSIYLGAFILVLPIIAFFINAFSFRWFYPQLIPKELSMQAWVRLKLIPREGSRTLEGFLDLWATNPTVIKALINSLTIGFVVTIVSIIIALPAARVLGLFNFKFKKLIIFLMVSPTILPPIAFVLGLNINFISLGFSGSFFGVCLVHLVPIMPYVVLTLTGIFANYNPDFEYQARTLGANKFKTFYLITLPAIAPGMVVAALFAFLVSWSQYLLTFLIGAGKIMTLPLLVFSTASSGNPALTAAISIIFIFPAILILFFTSKFVSGESSATSGFGKI
ncbi:MAG: Trehalose transport system permease protein SugB [Alphaproteobacteria bacterium MarineAlpha5_Bin5]|nr:MAG: Trehalose transport system permease protein SugB [Alphaproteobacteria bacterium MarineAlpha5_Bin5]